MARDLVGALALDRGDALHPRRQAGQRRQVADGAQAIEQKRDRAALVVRGRLEPAGERAEEGARVAIAQTHLRRRAAIGDRAQRLGDRLRRRPGQADELAAARRHALDHGARRRRCRAPARRRAGDAGRRRRRARRARRRRAARAAPTGSIGAARPSRRAVRRRRGVGGSGTATASAITLAWPRSLMRMLCSCRSRWAMPASWPKARPRRTPAIQRCRVLDRRRRMLSRATPRASCRRGDRRRRTASARARRTRRPWRCSDDRAARRAAP